MILRKIDLTDAHYLRGMAILLIMLHNYFHILEGAPGENEFGFLLQHTRNFLENLSTRPLDFARQLFSFWGHYGVQIFIFLSGYGLASKYGSHPLPSYRSFVFRRINRVYPVLFVAVIALAVYKVGVVQLVPAKDMDLSTFAEEALLKLSLLSNLIPGEGLSISGPWWFFSMIIQLYLLTPLLLKANNRILILLMGSAWLLQLLVVALFTTNLEYLRVNFIGHLPEYCLGIYLARHKEIRLPPGLAFTLFLLFLAGSFTPYLWVVSFLCVPLLSLYFYQQASPWPDSLISRTIRFFGENSLYFFAVHGLCRAPFVALGNRSPLWSIAGALLFLLTVTVLSLLFKRIVLLVEKLAGTGGRKWRQKNRLASFL